MASQENSPKVAVDSYGNVTAVWVTSTGLIQALTKPYRSTWQTTPDTLSIEGQQCQWPCLAVNAAGDAVAVWNFRLDNLSEVQVSSKTYGKTWEEAQRISLEGHTSILQQVIIDPFGDATAIWALNIWKIVV